MSEKKYQIFISSTFSDLEEARDKVSKVVLGLHHFPIGMEMFSAGDLEQWEVIKDTIDVSDYYVLIIGQRYGSLADDGVGYTEKEYDYAKEKGIPILAFIQDQNIPTAPDDREIDPEKIQKLKAFIAKAKNNKMCDFWKFPDELTTKVAIALPKSFARSPRQGWSRGGGASSDVMEELASLSRENRYLKEELEALRGQDKTRPDLSVTVCGKQEVFLDIKKEMAECYSDEELPDKADWKALPSFIQANIKRKDLEAYNSKLPTRQAFDAYKARLAMYEYENSNAKFLNLEVFNKGFSKANDISVEIYFPDFVKLYDEDEWESRERPSILIPETLESLAKRRVEQSRHGFIFGGLAMTGKAQGVTKGLDIPKIHSPFAEVDFSVESNFSKIRLKSLLHKRSFKLDEEIIALPLQRGEGIIKVRIICEEFAEEFVQDVPIFSK